MSNFDLGDAEREIALIKQVALSAKERADDLAAISKQRADDLAVVVREHTIQLAELGKLRDEVVGGRKVVYFLTAVTVGAAGLFYNLCSWNGIHIAFGAASAAGAR